MKHLQPLNRSEGGFVLVSVLLLLTVIGLLSGIAIAQSRAVLDEAIDEKSRFQNQMLVEAAFYRAVFDLQQPDISQTIFEPDTEMDLFGENYELTVRPLSGRIDLNRAPQSTFAKLFQELGLDKNQSASLAGAIADWRDPDSLKRLNGAENAEYRAAGRNYGPQNDPFEIVSELNWVLGMTPEIYQCLERDLTVHSGRPGVDPAFASEFVRNALNFEKSKSGIEQSPSDGNRDIDTTYSIRDGDVIEIIVSIPLPDDQVYTLSGIVRLTGNVHSPYWILDWKINNFAKTEAAICAHDKAEEQQKADSTLNLP